MKQKHEKLAYQCFWSILETKSQILLLPRCRLSSRGLVTSKDNAIIAENIEVKANEVCSHCRVNLLLHHGRTSRASLLAYLHNITRATPSWSLAAVSFAHVAHVRHNQCKHCFCSHLIATVSIENKFSLHSPCTNFIQCFAFHEVAHARQWLSKLIIALT